MKFKYCAKCGALLGKNEFNFIAGIEETVCDYCYTEYEVKKKKIKMRLLLAAAF